MISVTNGKNVHRHLLLHKILFHVHFNECRTNSAAILYHDRLELLAFILFFVTISYCGSLTFSNSVFALLPSSCCYNPKEVDPVDISKIISMSDDNQPLLWSNIDKLAKVSSRRKMALVVNTTIL